MSYGFAKVFDDLSGIVIRHKRSNLPFCELFKESITRMIDENGTSLNVMLSGGADSEILLRELVNQGAKVEAHTIRYGGDLNRHDVEVATNITTDLGVKHVFHDVDIFEIAKEQRYEELAKEFRVYELVILALIEPVLTIDGVVVFGHTPTVEYGDGQWALAFDDHSDFLGERLIQKGHQVVNYGMCYTPELLHSWLVQPAIERATSPNSFKLSIESSKNTMYREAGLVVTAPRKFRGFEKIHWLAASWRRDHRYLNRSFRIDLEIIKSKKDDEVTILN